MNQLGALILMAAGTFALRALVPRLLAARSERSGLRRFLDGVPAATAAALLIPGAFQGGAWPPAFAVAGLLAALLGTWFTRQLWVAVLAAATTMYGLLLLGH
jgi:branched-subunit amino acid transport protein